MFKIERIESGIPGLDKLLNGGLPKHSVVMVTGGAGTGKTIFVSQYLWHGLKNDENCLFITLEETPKEIKADCLLFGWDFSKYETTGKLKITYHDPFEMTEIINRLSDLIQVNKIKRVVIDSISLFGLYMKDEYKTRKTIYKLVQSLKETDCTAIVTSEMGANTGDFSTYGVEEFVVDGVIILHYLGVGEEAFRNVEIRKMRRTSHKTGTFPFRITDKGIVISR